MAAHRRSAYESSRISVFLDPHSGSKDGAETQLLSHCSYVSAIGQPFKPTQHCGFFRVEILERASGAGPDRPDLFAESAFQPRIENSRMNVTATAHCARIVQLGRNALAPLIESKCLRPLRLRQRTTGKFQRCKHGRIPGAKMLRGKIRPNRFADVIVHVLGIDLAACSILIDILEQMLPREFLDGADDLGYS